jgi:hypothetical protein
MNGVRRVPLAGRWIVAVLGALVALAAAGTSPRAETAAAIPHWTGAIDLYRSGVFTTQKTWLWCTAADVQIVRNIADHAADHSRANQERYFDAMRAHNRYDIPVADGVDPAGWTYGLRHFVDGRYRLVASGSFNAALRSAVTNLRRTNLPVGITVAHGTHAWVLTGFNATADPAATTRFTVTSVRVVGPLWGLQSTSYGYDMRPDTTLSPKQLAGFFTPWHYGKVRMAWEGDWVSIQPFVDRVAASPPPTAARPSPTASPRPTPTPTPTASPSTSSSGAVVGSSAGPAPSDVAFAGGIDPTATSPSGLPVAVTTDAGGQFALVWIVAGVLVTIALAIALIRSRRGWGRPDRGAR